MTRIPSLRAPLAVGGGSSLLSRWIVKRTPIRLVLSTIAGLITFYVVAAALRFGTQSEWLLWQYYDPLHIPTFAGRLVTSEYFVGMNDTGMFTNTLWADRLAKLVTLGFWTLLFGTLYFRFVFRGIKRSNQALQPTAGPIRKFPHDNCNM